MSAIKRFLLCGSLSLPLVLAACDDLPEWMGGSEEKPPLAGTRIAVLSDVAQATPDATLKDMPVSVPEAQPNTSWAQPGGSGAGLTGNLAWTGFKHHDSVAIGEGNSWRQSSTQAPVIADGRVYAMDARGYITAHEAGNISAVKWTNKSAVEEDEPELMGGGLAEENGKLFATTGYGKVVALNAATGKELWKISLGVPLRNAPKAAGDKVFVLSIDNQLFVLDATRGTQVWNHRGITENAGFITAVSPSVKETMVLAPYSSGELHALDAATGQEVWNDTLILSRHTTATGGFSGISGAPVIADDTVYTGDSGGFFAAITLLSGRRVWEQDIPTLNPAWVAGDFIYLLSDTQQLVCLLKADGRVKWTRQLPRYANEAKRKNAYVWRGPILAGGQLLVAGEHGEMLALSPRDGTTLTTVEIPDAVTNTPAVASGRLYFLTQDARLHVYY